MAKLLLSDICIYFSSLFSFFFAFYIFLFALSLFIRIWLNSCQTFILIFSSHQFSFFFSLYNFFALSLPLVRHVYQVLFTVCTKFGPGSAMFLYGRMKDYIFWILIHKTNCLLSYRICMNEDPGKRPSFDMIIPILEKMKK